MRQSWVATLVFLGLFAGNIAADVPKTIHYQGRLTDITGNPMPDGSDYSIHFYLYQAATGGTPVWDENHADSISVTNGYFSVELGGITSFNSVAPPVDFANPLYIEVAVHPDGPMTPRQKINSVPSALAADAAHNSTYAAYAYTLEGIPANGFIFNDCQAVETVDLADDAVTRDKMAPDSVGQEEARFAPVIWKYPFQQGYEYPRFIPAEITSDVNGNFTIDLAGYGWGASITPMVFCTAQNANVFVALTTKNNTTISGATYQLIYSGSPTLTTVKVGSQLVNFLIFSGN